MPGSNVKRAQMLKWGQMLEAEHLRPKLKINTRGQDLNFGLETKIEASLQSSGFASSFRIALMDYYLDGFPDQICFYFSFFFVFFRFWLCAVDQPD